MCTRNWNLTCKNDAVSCIFDQIKRYCGQSRTVHILTLILLRQECFLAQNCCIIIILSQVANIRVYKQVFTWWRVSISCRHRRPWGWKQTSTLALYFTKFYIIVILVLKTRTSNINWGWAHSTLQTWMSLYQSQVHLYRQKSCSLWRTSLAL